MQSLVIFSCLIAATIAATPFFESPHNEKASTFYKKPAGHYVPVAPEPVYKPAPVPVYKPAPAPAYKPEPYKAPEYKGDYGHGATSYQKINLEVGESSYKSYH